MFGETTVIFQPSSGRVYVNSLEGDISEGFWRKDGHAKVFGARSQVGVDLAGALRKGIAT